MRVLVTGGAGFIGSHSVDALLAGGTEVVVLDNFSTGKTANLPSRARLTVERGDIRNREDVAGAIAGCTHVLHLAAQVSVRASVEDPPGSAQHNVLGFVNVLDAARRADVKRVVYASSASAFGDPSELPLSESSPLAPLSPYGLEKSFNEQYAALFRQLFGLSALGLRYFNVYGPRQDPASPYAGVINKFADRLRADQPLTVFGDGGQTRDFIFVKDVARVNVAALHGTQDGALCVGTGHSTTLLELVAALAACAGRTPEIRHEAPAVGDIRHSAMTPARLHDWFGIRDMTPLAEGLKSLV